MIDKKQTDKKELKPKEKLEELTIKLMAIGIFLLIMSGLYYTLDLLIDPLYNIISIIGSLLISSLKIIPLPIMAALIILIAAGIASIGTLLKGESAQDTYLILLYFFWSVGLIILPIILLSYVIESSFIEFFVGLGFIMLIAPPIVYIIFEGVTYLLRLIIPDLGRNPFND